jgi:hypothetical protein
MRSMRVLAVAAVAASALSAIAVSSAFAATLPEFEIAGVSLAATETIEAEQVGAQVLSAGGIEIECLTVKLQNGEIKPTKPGTDAETIVYGGCHQKAHPNCEARTKGGGVAGQIKTNPLSSKLYYRTKNGAEGGADRGKTDTLLKPATGNTFVEIELIDVGEVCPFIAVATIEGEVAVENAAGKRVEQIVTAPATVIKTVWEQGVPGITVKVKELKAFGFTGASYVGTDKVKLIGANLGKEWGVLS